MLLKHKINLKLANNSVIRGATGATGAAGNTGATGAVGALTDAYLYAISLTEPPYDQNQPIAFDEVHVNYLINMASPTQIQLEITGIYMLTFEALGPFTQINISLNGDNNNFYYTSDLAYKSSNILLEVTSANSIVEIINETGGTVLISHPRVVVFKIAELN